MRPKGLEVADIFRQIGPAYREQHADSLSRGQRRAMTDIERCRTAALGGHLEQCDACGHQRISFNSCRSRHCPKCQSLTRAQWLEDRQAELLPVEYFHVVFTLPTGIADVALANRTALYELLFAAASATLAELARGRPTTEAALRRVSGVGDFRLQSFGETFLDAIRQYCQRTGVPTDVPMPKTFAVAKAVSSKPSPKKDAGFQMFRKGASVAKVAEKVGVSTSTVTEYLAEFIQLEKPASIFGWVPEDVCERVAAAAEMHGTARLKPVFLELNEEVSYEQIRIVFAFLALQGPR